VPWHYTTIVDLVDHWQTLLAGLIALIAAIITVFVMLKVERRKADRQIEALRKSLAIELRHCTLLKRLFAAEDRILSELPPHGRPAQFDLLLPNAKPLYYGREAVPVSNMSSARNKLSYPGTKPNRAGA
jgi:hypothetical protein